MGKRKREQKRILSKMIKQSKQTKCQSVKALFFTHCSQKMEDVGYCADLVNIGGSAILLRYNYTYFILTALHVVDSYLGDRQQNESPIFCVLRGGEGERLGLNNTGFVNIKWNISELLPDKDGVNKNDVVLLQLSDPFFNPDSFIDLDQKNSYRVYSFCPDREDNVALLSGYPMRINEVAYPIYGDESYSFNTNCIAHLKRDHVPVVLTSESSASTIEFKNHDELNGMSGGLVTLVNEVEIDQELVGMALTGGNGKVCFYPMKELLAAVRVHQRASWEIVDPAVTLFDLEVYFSERAIHARKKIFERGGG